MFKLIIPADKETRGRQALNDGADAERLALLIFLNYGNEERGGLGKEPPALVASGLQEQRVPDPGLL